MAWLALAAYLGLLSIFIKYYLCKKPGEQFKKCLFIDETA